MATAWRVLRKFSGHSTGKGGQVGKQKGSMSVLEIMHEAVRDNVRKGENLRASFLQYNQQDAPVSQVIYSCKKLYMFRPVFPSIIRSWKLHIRQQTYVKQLLYNQQDAPVSQVIYSCEKLYMFPSVFPSIIRSWKLHIRQQTYVKQLLYNQQDTPVSQIIYSCFQAFAVFQL